MNDKTKEEHRIAVDALNCNVNDTDNVSSADVLNDNRNENVILTGATNNDVNNLTYEDKKSSDVKETTGGVKKNILDNKENNCEDKSYQNDDATDEALVDKHLESSCDMSVNDEEIDSVTSTKGSDTLFDSDEDVSNEDSDLPEDIRLNSRIAEEDFNQEFDPNCFHNMYRLIRIRTRNKNPDLPSTVTKLETKEGALVYVVGTAHFSTESQEDVSKTITQVLPDVIVLELCKSRMTILDLDEESILKEAANMNFEKMRDSINQNGLFQGLMYILLLSLSAQVTKSLGMAPGGEFRRAAAEARENRGCIIHLGDRPIHITIQRALAALSWRQTFSLGWQLLFHNETITPEDVEKCKDSDLLEKMISDMTGQYPELTKVFVDERDKYLAHQLHVAANSISFEDPTEFERHPTVVVGVVGIGHVSGIVANWNSIKREDIYPLMVVPGKSKVSRCIKFGFRMSIISLAVWGIYKIMPSVVKDVIPSVPLWSSVMSKLK